MPYHQSQSFWEFDGCGGRALTFHFESAHVARRARKYDDDDGDEGWFIAARECICTNTLFQARERVLSYVLIAS
jgi:hypothetical protein